MSTTTRKPIEIYLKEDAYWIVRLTLSDGTEREIVIDVEEGFDEVRFYRDMPYDHAEVAIDLATLSIE